VGEVVGVFEGINEAKVRSCAEVAGFTLVFENGLLISGGVE
jgi:hypothetical protein